jgi:lysophospholipase L1-like esterase
LWHSDWINVVDKLDMDSIDFLLENKLKQDSLADTKIKEHREYFWPDGGHPNRKGHRVLYEYIFNKVINQQSSIL